MIFGLFGSKKTKENVADLLTELVDIFWEDCPRLLAEIRGAVDRGDSKALARSAHALKGSVGTFGAQLAFVVVQGLEAMGRNGNIVISLRVGPASAPIDCDSWLIPAEARG